VSCNDARTLGEVVAEFDGMRRCIVLNVRKLARIDVVHRRCVRASEPLRSHAACEHEGCSRRPVWAGVERDFLGLR